ncbi:MAG: methyltransferase domain-containing protein [Patescibacteria group bacterium]|jgi:tRNA G10  N-methylase Trm11
MKLAVLGNTPELSALELGVDYTGGQVVLINPVGVIHELPLRDLGGTVKIADQIDGNIDEIYQLLEQIPADHKLVFGFSVYAGDETISASMINDKNHQLRELGLTWKKKLREGGRSVRFVVSNETNLSSVIVTKEHLLRDQTDFIVALYKDKTIFGRTTAVQDFKTFSQNDYGRPKRDSFSGMLPPKVARMMLNIARPMKSNTILDPFCGSGTVVQEALQLGYTSVVGSDISPQCIADTQANLSWAKLPEAKLICADVLKLKDHLSNQAVDVIVGEGTLGPVQLHNINQIKQQLTDFYSKVFIELSKLLKPTGRMVLALPAWKQSQGILQMDLDQAIKQAGFTVFHKPIFYGRDQARVLRKIYFLKRT